MVWAAMVANRQPSLGARRVALLIPAVTLFVEALAAAAPMLRFAAGTAAWAPRGTRGDVGAWGREGVGA